MTVLDIIALNDGHIHSSSQSRRSVQLIAFKNPSHVMLLDTTESKGQRLIRFLQAGRQQPKQPHNHAFNGGIHTFGTCSKNGGALGYYQVYLSGTLAPKTRSS